MIEELNKICYLESDVNLKKYNTFRLDSKAKCIIFPSNIDELTSVLNVIKKYNSKWFIIGNGSNIILPDYYDGIIIKLNFKNYSILNDILTVDAGVMINKLANDLVNEGYKGLDFACGIPGSVGGCVYGNAGCYGSEISSSLISATIFDGENIFEIENKDLKFAYRYSILKEKKNWIILSCKFKLEHADREELLKLVKERQEKRISSQDLTHPSNGSVFRNPEGLSAGKLIDDAGLKGTSVNDAMVSLKHANFIINNGHANSDDIINLIKKIKNVIKEKYDIDLVLEQEIIK